MKSISCILILLGFAELLMAGDTLNLAMEATVTTSYVSPWETLEAVKDGFEPAHSGDNSRGAYGNWKGESEYQTWEWVQYEWENARQLLSTSVYWWEDGAGIAMPTAAYVEYMLGGDWQLADSIGTEANKYNEIELNVWANKIRIHMISPRATGILEWKVAGLESGPCDTPVIETFMDTGEGLEPGVHLASVMPGQSVLMGITPSDTGMWIWKGPAGFSAQTSTVTLEDVTTFQTGTYQVTYISECGILADTFFCLTVRSIPYGNVYEWPEYEPTLDYDFRQEYPDIEMPTKDLDDCEGVVGTQYSGWWTFKWGADANPLVTEAAITPMLEFMNQEFAYFRDELGWPPDKRAKNGYRSAVYLYGSGLCTDNASNTDKGGWQGSIRHDGEDWPMVLLSYYPVYCFDPSCPYSDREYQTNAVVHEGIHSVLADLPGCRNAAWFHEGGNTWLQQEAVARRTENYSSVGYLNGCTFLAPFMPIECYSGWLQDGSFGGPSAEGVNMYEGQTQICTWRNYLGGNQYGNSFPVFLGETLGTGSIPWIWRYATGRVLEGMADTLGDGQIRRLISEYRAKQALFDLGKWSGASRKVLNDHFGLTIRAEWNPSWMNPDPWTGTPYVFTTLDENGWITPEYRTTPGWSGANQVPLIASGDTVVIYFDPLAAHMTCQLCYRAEDGTAVYGEPVQGGECALRLDKRPANGLVIAVVCNTDYIFEGETTRKAHFDYRIRLMEGVKERAHPHVRWFNWEQELDNIYTGNESSPSSGVNTGSLIYPNPLAREQALHLSMAGHTGEDVEIRIFNLQGRLVYSEEIPVTKPILIEPLPEAGIYMVRIHRPELTETHKLVIW